jgi:hypothetical protein
LKSTPTKPEVEVHPNPEVVSLTTSELREKSIGSERDDLARDALAEIFDELNNFEGSGSSNDLTTFYNNNNDDQTSFDKMEADSLANSSSSSNGLRQALNPSHRLTGSGTGTGTGR